MYFKKLFFLLIFILCFNKLVAGNLNLTKINTKNGTIQIEFNDTLQLSNFILIDGKLISPFYESNNNKHYFFYFLDRNFKNAIINSIQGKPVTNNNSNKKFEYKVNKCILVKKPKKILAFMSVIFDDSIEVNCNLLNGKYGFWIAWPAIKEKDKWNKLFNIKDRKLKEEIETMLIKYYKQIKNDNQFKK